MVVEEFIDDYSDKGTRVIFNLGHNRYNFNAIERMILSANGNLQRVLSALYNAPLKITVLHNELVSKDDKVWKFKRSIQGHCILPENDCNHDNFSNNIDNSPHSNERRHLKMYQADSIIKVYDADLGHRLEQGKLALGQLLRENVNSCPLFKLRRVGRHPTSGMLTRSYELSVSGVIECFIEEEFFQHFCSN